MEIKMCVFRLFMCFVHLQVIVFGQVVGTGMEMDVNKFFPHLLENSMHAINPMSANSAGNDCYGSRNNMYGNIPMGNPMQTGFLANERCPCQYQVNSMGCYICSCNTDSPKSDLNKPTPEVPGLNIPFQYPNGPVYTTNQHTDKITIGGNVSSSEKTQSTTIATTLPPKHDKTDVTTSPPTSYKTLNSTGIQLEMKTMKTKVRSRMATASPPLGDLYGASYKKALKESSFSEKYMAILVGLGVILSVFLILSVIFVLKWRTTRRELRRQQSELYFVEKTNRQSSVVSRLTLELEREKRASVYSTVEDDIQSLSPQADVLLTPTAPPLTPGQKQQTAFRYPADDNRHDYLELI